MSLAGWHAALADWPVYGWERARKQAALRDALQTMTKHHAEACPVYGQILASQGWDPRREPAELADLPFIPVRLFKQNRLQSVTADEVFKELTSSGTTGQQVSRIVLDRDTAAAQTRALVSIMQSFLGKARLPMLIIDHPGVIKDRRSFSARGAGILGLSTFGRDHAYALLDDTMQPNLEVLRAFQARYAGEPVLMFGFTFMVWQWYQALREQAPDLRFDQAILIHSGGWKKLQDQAVSAAAFNQALRERFGLAAIHNFYGMVEQVGSIFVECEHGRLHTPVFADVLIRRAVDWSLCERGEPGLIEVLSVLPTSYPGHALLTEDVGQWLGEDDCPCGRLGKTFAVQGRLPRAEVRGCSDTQPNIQPQR